MKAAFPWLILLIVLAGPQMNLNRCRAEPVPGPAADEKDLQPMLDRLNALADLIARNPQAPEQWRYLLEQGELLLQVALRSQGEERDHWLRMALESYYGAAVASPVGEPTACQRLAQLPDIIARALPGSPFVVGAALQDVRAEYMRDLAVPGTVPAQAQQRHCRRLARFAQEFADAPEAPAAVMEAGELSESLGRLEDARSSYHYLINHYPAHALVRKVRGALWRLRQADEAMQLELPLLYAVENQAMRPFDIKQLRGKLVVVYFWDSACPQCQDDFEVLKHVTDRYQFEGVEAVYVNLDSNPAQGRSFLSGKLTAGQHVYDKGGLDAPIAVSHGLQWLPQAFLIDKNGLVVRQSLQASQVEAEIASRLGPAGNQH